MTDAIRAAWRTLEVMAAGDGQFRARRIDDELPFLTSASMVAVDWQGLRHLLIPVPDEAVIKTDAASAGVRIGRHVLVDGDSRRLYVDVVCLKPHLNTLFDVIAGEMVEIARRSPLTAVPSACRQVLDRWRELIARAVGPSVSTSRLIGAWGELWFVLRPSSPRR